MKLISIVTPCYNEEENILEIYQKTKEIFESLPGYQYEHIFIDNASTDNTAKKIKSLIKQDKHIKLIINARNFGPIRSPYYGLLQAKGDAVIYLVADMQDPPDLIRAFIKKWEEGCKIVVGVKPETQEFPLFASIRRLFYRFLSRISEVKLIKNFTGFGLYDKSIITILRDLDEPYPYLRGLISEVGFNVAEIPYQQQQRKQGKSKADLYTLYDWAVLGITSHSKLPIRLATIAGFFMSVVSFLLSVIYLVLKLLFWNSFSMGMAPVLVGLFFFASVQLFFTGLLGEYIATIHTRVMNRPLVIESERVNF